MGETKSVAAGEGCQFPTGVDERGHERHCGRATVPAGGDPQGRGRPSSYCDDPAHNAAAAWRARQRLKAETGSGGAAVGEDFDRPVTMARETASVLLEQARRLVGEQHDKFERLAEQLAVLADPDAAAAQLDAVTADSEQRLAEAHASWTRTDQERREALVQRDEANAAAEEAATTLDERDTQLAEAHEQAAQQRARAETAETERDRLAEHTEELTGQLADRDRQLAETANANEELAAARDELTTERDAAREQATQQQARAEAAEAERDRHEHEAEQQRTRTSAAEHERDRLAGQLETSTTELADARDQARTIQEHEANTRAELAGVRAELVAARRATEVAEHNLADWRAHYETQLAEARGQPGVE